MLNAYAAILAAADHIEQYPEAYDFMQGVVPASLRQPACILARIGQFGGMPAYITHELVSVRLLRTWHYQFYQEIKDATPALPDNFVEKRFPHGTLALHRALCDTTTIPTALRTIADNYRVIPQNVRGYTKMMINLPDAVA